MTCKNCRWFKCCFERSRDYPCREFKIDDRTATKPNKGDVNVLKVNYLIKNTTAKNDVVECLKANVKSEEE